MNDIVVAISAGLAAGTAAALLVSRVERKGHGNPPHAGLSEHRAAAARALAGAAVAGATAAAAATTAVTAQTAVAERTESTLPVERAYEPQRRTRPRRYWLRTLLRGLVGGVMSCVLVVIPAAVFVRESLGGEVHRASVPNVQLSPADAAKFRALPPVHGAIPVITYHDISDTESRYAVTAQHFAEQMAMLKAAGFTTISARQFERFVAGTGTLPAKPVLLTFDDGIASAWRVADPILKRYHMRAVLFVITSQVDKHTPYYLSSRQLRALRDSGRWDLEAHTDDGHREVVTSPSGASGPFLTNREWLDSEDRYETLAGYTTRVSNDLDRCIKRLRALGVEPRLFAFPFSAATTPTNDRRVIPILLRLVSERFAVSLGDSAQHRYVARDTGRADLPRFLVTSTTTAESLFDDLAEYEPLPLPFDLAHPFKSWVIDQRKLGREFAGGGALRFSPPPKTWISAHWAPRTALPMRDATVRVLAKHLGTPTAGSAVTLIVRPDDNSAPASVTVGPTSVRIAGSTTLVCALRAAPSHRLGVAYHGAVLQVTVDGRRAGSVRLASDGGSGIGLGAWRDSASSPAPVVQTFTRSRTAALPHTDTPLDCTNPTDAARGGRSNQSTHANNGGFASSGTQRRSTWRKP